MIQPVDDPAALPVRGADPASIVRAALAVDDPVDRAVQITALLSDAQAWVCYLSAHRDQAVREMRANGASYGEVGLLLGVSKSRAQQLCVRLEHPSPMAHPSD